MLVARIIATTIPVVASTKGLRTPENKVKHKGAESLGAFILFGVTDNSVEICQILEKKYVLI